MGDGSGNGVGGLAIRQGALRARWGQGPGEAQAGAPFAGGCGLEAEDGLLSVLKGLWLKAGRGKPSGLRIACPNAFWANKGLRDG
jgi:hypothetical protein